MSKSYLEVTADNSMTSLSSEPSSISGARGHHLPIPTSTSLNHGWRQLPQESLKDFSELFTVQFN